MCTNYKLPNKNNFRINHGLLLMIVVFLILVWAKTTHAQVSPVSANVSVMPPFTSSLYDYIETQNKIVITLTHTQPDYPEVELYLRAIITSENGIKVSTGEGFKPDQPLTLQPGKTILLNRDNISNAFDLDHLQLEGVEIDELLNGSGLPEDYYQICVQAFDYYTDQPLSGEQPIGCSNLFNVTNLEPPIILSPQCDEVIPTSPAQIAQINWSIPAGALPGTLYHFEMVEIPEYSNLDPKEAFDASTYPPFYEESTKISTLMLNMGKVVLTPGYTYSFRIKAEDPSGKMHFRNNGYSEVCWFRYGGSSSPDDWDEKSIVFISPKDCSTDSVLLAAPPQGFYVGWRVLPFDAENYKNPLENLTGYQFKVEFFDTEQSQHPIWSTSTDQTYIQEDPLKNNLPFVSGNPYWVKVSVENSVSHERICSSERCAFRYLYSQLSAGNLTKRTVTGSLHYQFENQGATSFPIGQTEIRLRCLYLLADKNSGKQIEIPEVDVLAALSAETTFPQGLTQNQVASAITSANGNFAFHFSWPDNAPLGEVHPDFYFQSTLFGPLNGKLTRAFRIEIVSPYYSTPQTIVADNQTPHGMGEVLTYVYSYHLIANLSKGYKKNSAAKEELFGKKIHIFRKQKLPGIPLYEGNRLVNRGMSNVPPEIKNAGYYLVASSTATSAINDQGEEMAMATFTHLIENLVNGDEYYWYVEGSGLATAQTLSFSNDLSYFTLNPSQVQGNQGSINLAKNAGHFQFFFLNNSQSSSGGYSIFGNQPGIFNNSVQGHDQLSQGVNTGGFNGLIQNIVGNTTLETSDVSISNTGNYSFKVDAKMKVITTDPPMSGIKGRVVYEFPGKPGNARPLANRQISIVSCLVSITPGQTSKIVKTNYNEDNAQAFPHARVLFTSKTDANGNFSFQFPNIEPENPDPSQGNFEVSTGNLNRTSSWISWESDPEKSFRIKYEPKQVKVKRVLRLVIDDPTGLFMSPDDNLTIEPLETVDVGTLTSNVMSYCLKGGVGWNKPSFVPGGITYDLYASLMGVECFVLRKKSEINSYQLPSDEGQNIIGALEEQPDFKIISMSTSASDGSFTFDNILFRNCLAPIYLYFRTKEMETDINYQPKFANQNVLNPFRKPLFLFNSDYKYTTITGFSTAMLPNTPTLKGKVTSNVSAGKGVAYASVKLRFTFTNSISEKGTWTDTLGYFDFSPVFANFEKSNMLKDLVKVDIEVKKSGFHYMKGNERNETYVNTYLKEDFQKGKQKIVNVPLYGNGSIKGRIVNEQGSPVDAYVQFLENRSLESVGEGTLSQTNGYTIFNVFAKGTFEIPAIPGNNRKLVVIPKDVAYFSDTLTLDVLENSVTNRGDIVVYERSHRIRFDVKTLAGYGNMQVILPVKGAKVELVGSPTPIVAYANDQGKVLLSFKNVSETNLSVKVSGPANSSYVPKNMSFTNFESEQVVQLPTVYLEKGLTVKGKVLLDGKPTSEAEVFVELSSWQTGAEFDETSQGESAKTESQYLFKAYPKSDGTFEINTIPPELKGKQIYLKAVYKEKLTLQSKIQPGGSHGNSTTQPDQTVIGDEKLVPVPNESGNLEFNLTSFNKMHLTHIWGFPIEITRIQPQINGEKYYVSGRLKLEGYSPGFDPLEPLTLEFNNVVFAPSAQIIDGKPVGVPDQDQVIVSLKRSLKLRYAKAFNVKLDAPNHSLFTIIKDPTNEGKGKLNASVAIVDNSFQYPSTYLNFDGVNFNFCNKTLINNKTFIFPIIDVFNSSKRGNGNDVVKYNLCNLNDAGLAENLVFKFINFETRADAATSFIEGDEITLSPTLTAKLKNAGDVEIQIGKLVLKNNTIAPVSGNTPIMVELKDGGIYNADKAWKIEAKNWKIDPKIGGLQSEDCVLHTGSIDVPFSYFNLRSDFAYLGEPQTSEINLGGYPITFASSSKVAVGYNESCASDKKGHWQLIFYPPPSGNTPAWVDNLPNMNNGRLDLETVSLYSNGDNVFTIGTGAKKLRLYNVVSFKPQNVFALTDGFVLSGIADFCIPRVRDGVGARLTFVKNAGSGNGNPKFDPIDLDFEGKGNIKFTTNPNGQAFNSAARTFTTYGTVQEPGVLAPIQVKLTYTDNNSISLIKTEIVESDSPTALGQKVKIGKDESTCLENVKCKTTANQSDWDLFVFEGDLTGAKGVAIDSKKHMVFTVHGEIKAAQDGFKANGISKSFDGIQITYQNDRLIGTLNMVNVPLGSSIVNGVANLLMDSDGWAFYSNCKATNVPAPDPCTINMGILIGDYTTLLPEMTNTVLQYAVKKELPATFNKGLHGFYMVGGRELPISGLDININVVVAKAYVRVPIAALDASFYLNLESGNAVFGTGISGRLLVEFGLGSITCTELSGSGDAKVSINIEGSSSGSLDLSGDAYLNAKLSISQGVPIPFSDCEEVLKISINPKGGFSFRTKPSFNANFYTN